MEISFDWRDPIKFKPLMLKAKAPVNGWSTEWTEGFISSVGDRQAFIGGKIAVYKSHKYPESGYFIVNGYDELEELFEMKHH